MAFIEQVTIENAKGATKKVYDAAMARVGGVANIIRVMSLDGRIAGASMGLYVSMMQSTNALSGSQREMLAAVVSNANDCYY